MRTVEHFKNLSAVDLMAIVTSGQVLEFKANSTLFCEGDPCAGMYVLLTGKIDLYKTGPEGQISIINSLSPVIMFNEVPVLDGGPNPISALAVEDSRVWFIRCDHFRKLLKQYPELATGLLRVLAMRNRVMIAHYCDLSFRSVPARVAKHLIELSKNGSVPVNRSTNSNKIIAAKVVTTPEAVSRTIKQISSRKLIEINRVTIHVLDVEGLQKIAQLEF